MLSHLVAGTSEPCTKLLHLQVCSSEWAAGRGHSSSGRGFPTQLVHKLEASPSPQPPVSALLAVDVASGTSCLHVTVSSEGRTSVTFTANLGDRVRKINEHVRAKTKIPVQDQVLLLGSKMLKPQRRLSSYSIDKETTVHLTLKVVKPSEDELPVTLVQAGDGGQGHLLQVRRSSSVAQEKQMIETKTAIAPEQQIVTCNGKRLEDGKTMADYGIRRGTALWLADYCIGG
ncbi:ubiquitin D-like [Meles meles]|uniref:ubiquitin D-like n=1 Tax=Meles meles TaxID=9662 RepID=UPI001E69F03A|nr:ubiquitin D-like [Meles meles]